MCHLHTTLYFISPCLLTISPSIATPAHFPNAHATWQQVVHSVVLHSVPYAVATARQVVQQLRRRGRVVRPYLGFSMVALTPQVQVREPGSRAHPPHWAEGKGVMVVGLAEGSPAQKAGLQPGDVITSFDGRLVGVVRERTPWQT